MRIVRVQWVRRPYPRSASPLGRQPCRRGAGGSTSLGSPRASWTGRGAASGEAGRATVGMAAAAPQLRGRPLRARSAGGRSRAGASTAGAAPLPAEAAVAAAVPVAAAEPAPPARGTGTAAAPWTRSPWPGTVLAHLCSSLRALLGRVCAPCPACPRRSEAKRTCSGGTCTRATSAWRAAGSWRGALGRQWFSSASV